MKVISSDLRALTAAQLGQWLTAVGEPGYRSKQIMQWLWQKQVRRFDQMSDLSKDLRRKLAENYELYELQIANCVEADDGTLKFTLRLFDNQLIESVLIPTENRITACVSSQVGCPLGCKFCATGFMGLKRNLLAYEIFDQVAILQRQAQARFQRPLTNIVYMGMGEPLLNYSAVIESINHIISPYGLGMAAKRITVSTSGIAKTIERLADDNFRCELALSLHSADNERRSEIMPINQSNPLPLLVEALRYFYRKTRRVVTYEYVLLAGINDSIEDAKKLVRFCSHIPCKVNLIEYNPITEADFVNSRQPQVTKFRNYLESKGITVTFRRSRGRDAAGACGQLAIRQVKTDQP